MPAFHRILDEQARRPVLGPAETRPDPTLTAAEIIRLVRGERDPIPTPEEAAEASLRHIFNDPTITVPRPMRPKLWQRSVS